MRHSPTVGAAGAACCCTCNCTTAGCGAAVANLNATPGARLRSVYRHSSPGAEFIWPREQAIGTASCWVLRPPALRPCSFPTVGPRAISSTANCSAHRLQFFDAEVSGPVPRVELASSTDRTRRDPRAPTGCSRLRAAPGAGQRPPSPGRQVEWVLHQLLSAAMVLPRSWRSSLASASAPCGKAFDAEGKELPGAVTGTAMSCSQLPRNTPPVTHDGGGAAVCGHQRLFTAFFANGQVARPAPGVRRRRFRSCRSASLMVRQLFGHAQGNPLSAWRHLPVGGGGAPNWMEPTTG